MAIWNLKLARARAESFQVDFATIFLEGMDVGFLAANWTFVSMARIPISSWAASQQMRP